MSKMNSICGDCDGFLYDYCSECHLQEKRSRSESMSNGEAIAIFKQIKSDKYTVEEKGWAIYKVLSLATDNSILKKDYWNALHWLFWQHFEVKDAVNILEEE